MTGPSASVQPSSVEQTDEEVVQKVIAGNTAIFELLMRRYNERLYRVARAALRRSLFERTGAAAPDAFRFYRPRCDRVVAKVLTRLSDMTLD